MKERLRLLNTSRVVFYVIGLLLVAVGIVFTKRCQWGISPDSSVPYVMELITGWSLGTWIMLFQFANAIAQMIILRQIKNLTIWLQFVYAILFAFLIDFVQLLVPTAPNTIFFRILFLAIGIICTAVGLFILTQINIVSDPVISLVKVISKKTGKNLGTVKNIYDIALVIIALVMSLVFTHQIKALGIATVASALLVGRVMHWCKKHIHLKEYEELFSV